MKRMITMAVAAMMAAMSALAQQPQQSHESQQPHESQQSWQPASTPESNASSHLSLDLRGSYFMRHAHYRDFTDVDAKTFEIRAGLRYHL